MRYLYSLVLMVFLVVSSMPLALAAAPSSALNVTIAKAPVAPDGTTAKAVSDFVVTFMNRNPSIDGVGIKQGGTVEVVLPYDFINTGNDGNTVVILQGWPQSPLIPFPWQTDIVGNTITLTLLSDWMPGASGPGPKQVHLLLFGFRNPSPGRYPVSITINPDPASDEVLSGVGFVQIIPKARPSVNAVSIFSGPPGPPPPFFNPLYQTVELGNDARQLGLYLWSKRSAPLLGVDLEMTNPTHGRLIDVDRGATVGQVWILPPAGAANFALNTFGPSTETNAFITGVPVGLLLVQFSPDPEVIGDYSITISTNNGNEEKLFVTVY